MRFTWPVKSPRAEPEAVVAVAYWYSRIRHPLVEGAVAQVDADTAELGEITYLGRARGLPFTVTVSECTVVVELLVGRAVLDSCQVSKDALILVNVAVDPSLSRRVKDSVNFPVRVKSSAPGSDFQPPALVAVNPISVPSAATTATEVVEVLRRNVQSLPDVSAIVPAVHCGPKIAAWPSC